MAIVNMSKQFPNLRFAQFVINAVGDNDPFYMTDQELFEKCKQYASLQNGAIRVFFL